MRMQIELKDQAATAWGKVSKRPEFAMSTKAGIIYALMLAYLKDSPTEIPHQPKTVTDDEIRAALGEDI